MGAQFSPRDSPFQKQLLLTFPLDFALIKVRDGGDLYSESDGRNRNIWEELKGWRGKIDKIGPLPHGQREERALGHVASLWMLKLITCAGYQKEK